MKKFSALFKISIMMTLMLASCAPRNAEVEYMSCLTDSATCALIDSKGELTPLGLLGTKISAVVNGFFTVSTPDGVAVYRLTKDGPEAVEGLSGLLSAGYMSCGVMPVCKPGHHIELVDGDGTTVATLELESGEITECWPAFTDGVLAVTTDSGLTGLVATDGHLIVAPKYRHIGTVADGLMIAMSETTEAGLNKQSYSVIDTNGKVTYEFPEGEVPVCEAVSAGKVAVHTTDGFALADIATGNVLTALPSQIVAIHDMREGLIVVRNSDGRVGVLNLEGNEVLAQNFRSVYIGPDGKLVAFSEKEWTLYDRSGKEICNIAGFQMIVPAPMQSYKTGFAFVGRAKDGYYLIDAAGQKVNTDPLYRIEAVRIDFGKVATDYATTTAHEELPEIVEEEMN